jgi:Na+:H+ antiporter, NhaA family
MFLSFYHSEKSGGFILIFCTILSLFLANSNISDNYILFFHKILDFSFFNVPIHFSVQHVINDGLMAIFFLMVGLEIERELYIGELSNFKNALLPIVAAFGGMVFPALIHFLLNFTTASQSGFGIPMATDIAFSLAALSLLGRSIPISLKIFLTAFAIIDDLGAISLIALFYSKDISIIYLIFSIVLFLFLLLLNKLRVFKLLPYIIIGFFMWFFMLKSGIHPTITGVLLAFAIPFSKGGYNPSFKVLSFLHVPVAFFILPAFAIANTCIKIDLGTISGLLSQNSAGIIAGLVIGKPLGIFIFSLLSIKTGICKLPADLGLAHIFGAGLLGGIGFTMSIFIANLAFTDSNLVSSSIIATIIASFISGIIGVVYLKTNK